MPIREKLDSRPRLAAGVSAAILVLAVGLIVWQVRANASPVSTSNQAYFTVDDGKTWFADASDKVPPFEHNGQQAVRCNVYRIDGTTKVVSLMKYPDAARDGILKERQNAKPDPENPNAGPSISVKYGRAGLVKRPGDAHWIPVTDREADRIVEPPDGELVVPD